MTGTRTWVERRWFKEADEGEDCIMMLLGDERGGWFVAEKGGEMSVGRKNSPNQRLASVNVVYFSKDGKYVS